MIPSFTSLISTIAGKVAVGLVVASTSVGAAAAAGADVPFVSSSPSPAVADEPVAEPADELVEEPVEEPAAELAVVAAEEPADGEADDAVESEAVGERPENHGAVVSGFVHETELEGCEKGQATAAVARGLLDPESETFEDDLATYLADLGKCLDTDEDTESDEMDEMAIEEEAEPNHGAVVSGFVHETELEGCQKGQATAAVARGDIAPGEDGTIDPVAVDEYLAGLDKCGDDDGESDGDDLSVESTDDDADDDGDDDKGKPDHAGQRGAERSQGKAKGPNK